MRNYLSGLLAVSVLLGTGLSVRAEDLTPPPATMTPADSIKSTQTQQKKVDKAIDNVNKVLKEAQEGAAKTLDKAAKAMTPAQPDIDPDMKKVLDAFDSLNPKPIETLTPAEARKQPTPADAVAKVLKDEGKTPAEVKPALITQDIQIPGPAGNIKARIYTPEGKGPFPVIVYYHGGGFVIADLNTYDASARALADKAKAIVVSSDYRQAPEHPFPASHEDAFAAYEWVLKNAKTFNGDPVRIAVAGESAGGNLAANVSIMARDKKIQLPVHQVLIYPLAGTNMNTASYIQNADAKPLNKQMMAWFFKQELKTAADWKNPKINLVDADLSQLPPTTLITATSDPLQSEGETLGAKMKAAGVKVKSEDYDGVTHEFFGMDSVVENAKEAQNFVAKQLKSAFNAAPTDLEKSQPDNEKEEDVEHD